MESGKDEEIVNIDNFFNRLLLKEEQRNGGCWGRMWVKGIFFFLTTGYLYGVDNTIQWKEK